MLINEVIERTDALLDNEYTDEEKYHWCDIVSAELNALYNNEYKRAELERFKDGTFLLPEDCEFPRIEKMICGAHELDKQDFRTYGLDRRPKRIRFIPKNWAKLGTPDRLTVVYLPITPPIRRIELTGERVVIDPNDNTVRMFNDCPFIPGDIVEMTYDGSTYTLNILTRTAQLDADTDSGKGGLTYLLETGDKELKGLGLTTASVGMKRVVTDRTVCGAPYDEMYVDYLCAQICFYQRKHDVYQQFISRYNTRQEEYARFMKERAARNDRTVFRNWWRL